jgi:hypothetical protein
MDFTRDRADGERHNFISQELDKGRTQGVRSRRRGVNDDKEEFSVGL